MEAIREYLNNLFMSLPETPAVLRAKAELLEMMEDKYEELIREGKSEKEAVGIVLSEFGNFEELAEELGIDEYLNKNQDSSESAEQNNQTEKQNKGAGRPRTECHWSFNEAKEYVEYSWKHAAYIAVGVMFCIWSPYLESVLSSAGGSGYMPAFVANAIGTSCMFLLIAVAVGLFCAASAQRKRYGNIARYQIVTDEKAAHYLTARRDKDEQRRLYFRIFGVALCILSVVPSSVNFFENPLVREIVDSSVLAIVGVGVLLLILSCSVGNRYDELRRAQIGAGTGQNVQNPQSVPVMEHHKRGMPLSVVLLLIFLGFVVVGGSIAGGIIYSVTSYDGETSQTKEQYDVQEVEKVLVDMDMGTVNIEMGEVDAIQFEYSGNTKQSPVVTNENGVLRVKEKGSGGFHFSLFRFWPWNSGEHSTTIIIPANQTGIIYEIEADAGNVNLSNVQGKSVKIDVDAGNIEASGCVFAEKSTLEADAGNINVSESSFHYLNADVDAGNLECHLTDPVSWYDLDLDVDLGDVEINGQKMGGTYKAQPGADAPEGGYHIKAEVDLGNIEITGNESEV